MYCHVDITQVCTHVARFINGTCDEQIVRVEQGGLAAAASTLVL